MYERRKVDPYETRSTTANSTVNLGELGRRGQLRSFARSLRCSVGIEEEGSVYGVRWGMQITVPSGMCARGRPGVAPKVDRFVRSRRVCICRSFPLGGG